MNNRTATGFTGRGLIVTLLVSLGLHAAAVIAALLLLRAGVPVADAPDKPTEVELVMVERQGDLSPATAPSPPPPAQLSEQPSRQEAQPSEAGALSPPTRTPVEAQPDAEKQTTAPAEESVPAAASAETPVQAAMRDPAPPAAQSAPTISIHGTDSPSNARAFGDRVIPAAPDAVFHNRPPVYPREAAIRGEQGIVVVLIHVSPAGTAAGVDLLTSSGYALLDSAAREAVLRWRFLPAVKDGRPVASDMQMGFEFDNQ